MNGFVVMNLKSTHCVFTHRKKRHLNTAYQAVQAVDYLMGLEDGLPVGLVEVKP